MADLKSSESHLVELIELVEDLLQMGKFLIRKLTRKTNMKQSVGGIRER